ncbi:MAG: pyrroloquinoline quinone-dependent dehydrogenase [Bryobacterales bacterium]|nr:pyrroloquinoline quinone-dependent dehydrogenase [Bryobacterales bacterium]
MSRHTFFLIAALVALGCSSDPAALRQAPASGYTGWEIYGGGNDQIRYSRLDQINRDNVGQLQVAWTYDTGDDFNRSEMQCNPIVVDGLLYATSPRMRIFALDAASGEERWSFEPTIDGQHPGGKHRNRGLMYWSDGDDARVYAAMKHALFALDAKTGKPVPEFGGEGWIDLREHLGRDPETLSVGLTTPGVVYGDLLIIGSITSEGLPSAPGDIRAFDARTGELRWSFHTLPRPGEPGYETWAEDNWKIVGGANAWAGLALDEDRGLVYTGTGSAAFDFWGGNRPGDNLYANTLLCLRAETGELVWHFQAVKHDVWDRDFPAPPSLITVKRDGKLIDAVSQAAKSGHVYVFERETGEPLFAIEEFDVPASDVPGEALATKQVLPTKPPPFSRQRLTEEDLTERTPEARKAVLERFRKVRSGPQFTPPSGEGTVIFPGFDGGPEWGGQAFDPETGLYYVNANEMAWILRVYEKRIVGGNVTGKRLYQRNCAACHLDDRSGTPPEFPALSDLGGRFDGSAVEAIIKSGVGRMPGYAHLGDEAVAAIAHFTLTGEDSEAKAGAPSSPYDLPLTHDGYNKFLDPEGYPAVKPPWGTLNAIDMDKGEIAWTIPFGEVPELAEQGVPATGTENYGGPIVTAGGLLFIGATNHDQKFRVFDKLTGKLLWDHKLPASGNATPAMYEVDGRQYVVIGAGGGKSGAPSGGSYVAFALPE